MAEIEIQASGALVAEALVAQIADAYVYIYILFENALFSSRKENPERTCAEKIRRQLATSVWRDRSFARNDNRLIGATIRSNPH